MTRDVQFLENEIWTMTQKESKEKWVLIKENFVKDNEYHNDNDSIMYMSLSSPFSPTRNSSSQIERGVGVWIMRMP